MQYFSMRWIPETPTPQEVINRLRTHFPKPKAPMGEAWFITDRRKMFHELGHIPIAEVPLPTLINALGEIASGTHSFGPMDEWNAWFMYLLPDLVLRSHEDYAFEWLHETTITAFMSLFPLEIPQRYPEFRQDVLDSLFAAIMRPPLWKRGSGLPIPTFLDYRGEKWRLGWRVESANSFISSSLFFGIKYLRTEEIESWVESLVGITAPKWKANLIVWLLGAHDLLMAKKVLPSAIEKASPQLSWSWSHVLQNGPSGLAGQSDFYTKENVEVFFHAIKKRIGSETIEKWELEMLEDDELLQSMTGAAESLQAKLKS